jgi:hypothetical protein
MTWVYRKTEAQLWTVGFYDPDGAWYTDDDFDTKDQARARVSYLNGGKDDQE